MSIYINQDFYYPNLNNDNHHVTSPSSPAYNCVAWAAGETYRRWEPSADPTDAYWPAEVPREDTQEAFIAVFRLLGYEPCSDGTLEPGFEKLAVYTDSQQMFTHVARQLEDGQWTSKMGDLEDISHASVESVEGRWNGTLNQYLRRPTRE